MGRAQFRPEMPDGLIDIGDQIGIGERNAFGFALRTRGKQDHRRLVRIKRVTRMQQARKRRLQYRFGLIQRGNGLAHILQIDNPDSGLLDKPVNQIIQLGHFDKAVGGDDGIDFSRLNRRADIFETGGEIERRDHPPIGRQRKQADHRGIHAGQQEPHRLAPFGDIRKGFAQHQSPEDQPVIGQGRAFRIFQGRSLTAELIPRIQQSTKNCLVSPVFRHSSVPFLINLRNER